MKLAVVSRLLPPSLSGQAMMLYRLLKDVSPDDYCLVSAQAADLPGDLNYARTLPGKYFQLSTRHETARGHRSFLPVLREAYNVTWGALMRGRQIADIVGREACGAVLSCSSGDDLLDVPSGFAAGRLARVPFYVYLFDTYSHMWVNPRTKFMGRWLEPPILKRAAGVVVTNEAAREVLRARYGVESVVIHNPCDLSDYDGIPEGAGGAGGGVRVVYTGAIYQAHFDALRNLVRAVERLGRPEVKIHLYTAQRPEALAAEGIAGPVVYEGHQPGFRMPAVQRGADVLFLPLAFNSPYPELIRISSPSKIGEFLASRRPVLVHAPPDSFIATYFREHDCGLVVDRDDPRLLAEALERLLSDEPLRRRLAANAWERAVSDFSLPVARSKFAALFGLKPAAA